MTVADELRAAWARIENPDHWCQRVAACDSDGARVRGSSSLAVRWCASGSLASVELRGISSLVALHRAAKDLYGRAPHEVNDKLGHGAVRAVYMEAIRRAEGDG